MPKLRTNGAEIHYRIDDFTPPWQASEVVLIQHGFGRNSSFWYAWVPRLSGRLRVVRRDMRAHGRSADPGAGASWTIDVLLEDLRAFLDALGLDRVHYVGESLGGMLGVAFAARWPERLASLTLCAAPTAIHAHAQRIFALCYDDWQTALERLGSGAWGRSMVALGGALDALPERAAWVLREWSTTPTHALVALSRLAQTVDVAPLLPQVRVPTLILAPRRSPFTSVAEQAAIHAAIPGSTLAWIEGPGHEIYADAPEACTRAFLDFLDTLSEA